MSTSAPCLSCKAILSADVPRGAAVFCGADCLASFVKRQQPSPSPIPSPMLLWCPDCGERHIDRGEFATRSHHSHACQHCGMVWRPAIEATVGVQFLPGFKDAPSPGADGDPT